MTFPFEDPPSDILPEAEEKSRPNIITALILLILVLSLLTSLLWPLIRRTVVRPTLPPTPTSPFLQEAKFFKLKER